MRWVLYNMDENFDSIFSFLRESFQFNNDDEVNFQKYFQREFFKKNEFVLRTGEICQKIYFIKKGLLRTFHINQNGTEFTRLIAKENEFCTILLSFSEEIVSAANIQSLEETELYSISKSDFKEFMSKSDNAKTIYTKILEDFQNFQIQRLEFLTSYSPQDKVEIFLKDNRKLEQRVSDKIIATYLQITPETYSRCKKVLLS